MGECDQKVPPCDSFDLSPVEEVLRDSTFNKLAAARERKALRAAAEAQGVVKMQIGPWQICNENQRECYVYEPTKQIFEHLPDELLGLLRHEQGVATYTKRGDDNILQTHEAKVLAAEIARTEDVLQGLEPLIHEREMELQEKANQRLAELNAQLSQLSGQLQELETVGVDTTAPMRQTQVSEPSSPDSPELKPPTPELFVEACIFVNGAECWHTCKVIGQFPGDMLQLAMTEGGMQHRVHKSKVRPLPMLQETTGTNISDLDGLWVYPNGDEFTISGKTLTLKKGPRAGSQFTLAHQSGSSISLNDPYKGGGATFTNSKIIWNNGGTAYKAADSSAPMVSEQAENVPAEIQALNGIWMRGPGKLSTIMNGKVCVNGKLKRITFQDGHLKIPQWTAVSITDKEVTWNSDVSNETRVWTRVQSQDGSDGNGSPCNAFSPMSPASATRSETTLTRGSKDMVFLPDTEISAHSAPSLEELEGLWTRGPGKFCRIECNRCVAGPVGVDIGQLCGEQGMGQNFR